MAVVSLRNVSFSFGGRPLIEQADVQIERGERISLVGRNGAGKSTLMRLMLGELAPDTGIVERQSGIRVARQIQEVPTGPSGTIFDETAKGLGEIGPAVAAHYRLHRSTDALPDAERAELERLAHSLDPSQAWSWEHDVEQTLDKMQLPPHRLFSELSSGMKRRVLLAKSLVINPDLLLLDEPTNHLDLDAIRWLEDFLARFEGTLVFVTHDRMFLSKLATRIIEIDRGRLFDWTCNYPTFLQRKEDALAAEEQQQALFDKKLAQEEAWLRQGVKARRTRNEGRVRALLDLRRERQARRDKVGSVKVELHREAERSGSLVVQATKLTYQIEQRTILRDLTTTIVRGDKVGVIGPNGCGKTTLLRLLLGQLQPTSGTVRLGTRLETGYFDQLRAQLDDEESVIENVAHGQTMLEINGKRRHIIGYLEDFLFSPERSKTLVRFLSGGERNRLLLARLFAQPTNLLVLDEPTNDLDTETLELLESLLVEYPGTVLLVSHDRAFLNNVVTQTLVYEDDGVVKEYAGGYDDWLSQRASAAAQQSSAAADANPSVSRSSTPLNRSRGLSFKEQRELEQLPKQIESWEAEQATLHERMATVDFYQQGCAVIAAATQQVEELHQQLLKAYARWEELEARAGGDK
ncbi:MAG: ATP-binding cassette domain-containing protein [Planctomycetaceae bacterium]|nr:ATP-binding cassette domain-containing protein [Planctomycetaceae bacterium]